jgi:geranylgeranyl pyrophosphate synthase
MHIYEQAIDLLIVRGEARDWKELSAALSRARGHKPVAWHFPVAACKAVGSQPEAATPGVAAITCAHMAIMLIDDILDEDPRGAYHELGVGRTANLALGLASLGINVLLTTTCRDRELAATALNDMVRRTAYGQDLDVMNPQTEERYWDVTRAKSSPYFGAALYIGALLGNASPNVAEQLDSFGHIYGEIMQIHDDHNDSLATPANVDWLAGRSPLPFLFAQLVAHPERERFMELRTKVVDPMMLQEAQSILVRSGAISYCVSELIKRCDQAAALLEQIPLANSGALSQLLDEANAPLKHLFAKVGADPAAIT